MKTEFIADKFKEKQEKIKKEQSMLFLDFETAFDKIEKQLKYIFDNIGNKNNLHEDNSNKIIVFIGSKPISPEDKIKLKNIYEEAGFKLRYKEEGDGSPDNKKYVIYLYY